MQNILNKPIGYTPSWKITGLIACMISAILCFILVYLQPFDTYTVKMNYKTLKLTGYFLPPFVSIICIHFLENIWFKVHKKWFLYQEIIIITSGTLLIALLCFIYLNYLVNDVALPWQAFFSWFSSFGLPFAPIILMPWVYLRFRFSEIQLHNSTKEKDASVEVKGENSGEIYSFLWSQFLLAKSQSNYVEIILKSEDEHNQKIILRSTLSKVKQQLPKSLQVHRSFLINMDNIQKLEGNSRKGWCIISNIEDYVPVSPKYFKALKMRLQDHP